MNCEKAERENREMGDGGVQDELGAKNAGQGHKPIARTATCFNRGHLSNVSVEMGILVVITTSASLILSTTTSISDGVEGYSVYVWLKWGEKVGEGVKMPSKRTIFKVIVSEESIL